MKNLFDPATAQDVKQRVLRLHPESQRQWGVMTLPQTLAHCTSSMHMAIGSVRAKRVRFPIRLLGVMIRPLVLGNDKPFRRNSPSVPELFPAEPARCDFEPERAELIAAIDTFASRGAPGCTRDPHPFFGRMQPQQWAILMYKHLDHHLRQFGA